MSSEAAASFVQKWRDARPLRDLAMRFLPSGETGLPQLAALEAELLGVLQTVDAPQVAAAKLAWWVEELAAFGTSESRHPLARALAADARAARVPAALWPQAALQALEALDAAASPDFDRHVQAAEALVAPFARIECAFVFGADAESARTSRVLALQLLGGELLRLPQRAGAGRMPLPLQSLARHGLARNTFAEAGDACREAVAEQCERLADGLREAGRMPGPLHALRAAEAVHDRRALQRAARASDPLQVLYAQRLGLSPAAAWACWRAARVAARGSTA